MESLSEKDFAYCANCRRVTQQLAKKCRWCKGEKLSPKELLSTKKQRYMMLKDQIELDQEMINRYTKKNTNLETIRMEKEDILARLKELYAILRSNGAPPEMKSVYRRLKENRVKMERLTKEEGFE